jgi:hypothetical protein
MGVPYQQQMSAAPHDLPEALREIEKLRVELAEAQRVRDSHWQTICKILPPIPPDYDFQEKDLQRLLAESMPAEQFLAEIVNAEAAK